MTATFRFCRGLEVHLVPAFLSGIRITIVFMHDLVSIRKQGANTDFRLLFVEVGGSGHLRNGHTGARTVGVDGREEDVEWTGSAASVHAVPKQTLLLQCIHHPSSLADLKNINIRSCYNSSRISSFI